MLFDGRLPLSPMNTAQVQSADSAPPFPRSPLDVPSILANPTVHLIHDLPPMYQPAADQPTVLTATMPVPVVPDVLTSPSQALGPAPAFMSDFQSDPFRISAGIDSDATMNSSPVHPPLPDPQVNPSAIHSINTGFTVTTSSLATALDDMSVNISRSRAGSTTSPGKHTAATAFPTVVPSLEPTGLVFPPVDFASPVNGGMDSSQEVPPGHPMFHVAQAFESVAGYTHSLSKTASSAKSACIVGQAQVNYIFDDLKKRWSHITELISRIDASLSLTEKSPPLHQTSPTLPVTALPAPMIGMITPPSSIDTRPMEIQPSPDSSDGSRKRCASSMASGQGDRVIKAPKMEPFDDVIIPIATSPTKTIPLSPPPHLFAPGTVSASSVMNHSLPPSAPPSRASTPPPVKSMNVILLQQSPHVNSPSVPPIEFAMPPQSVPQFPTGVRNRSSWSEIPTALPARHHQHSLSGTSLNTAVNVHGLSGMITSTSAQPFTAPGTFGTPSVSKPRSIPNGHSISPPLGRITRSGSITSPAVNPLSFGFPDFPNLDQCLPPRASAQGLVPHRVTPESDEGEETEDDILETKASHYNHSSPESGSSTGHGNEVPHEYRQHVDRIFFEFLNRICSNLDASDSKGEPIHQTLMAKKMQRLDESPDFRPFKFRIAAFTNAFLDELARQGYPEEKIPMKKIRNYLWRQEHIQRFNEDGKKAKSKGNHIWNIDAKKGRDGKWVFRPFHRKLAGTPPSIAYVGLKWSWTARIWDPQASSLHLPVRYSSPTLPHWLSWKDDVLSGTPPSDAESCEITVEARFTRDGHEEMLSHTFLLSIAPISTTIEPAFPSHHPRRPSIANSRRQSDTVVPQFGSRSILRPVNPAAQPPAAQSQGEQVMRVLTSAAQRVAQEAQSQVIASRSPSEPNGPQQELTALAKQQHVLQVTAAAVDIELTQAGPRQEGAVQSQRSVLAAAAQEVVMQAARTVRADRSASAAGSSQAAASAAAQPVTVNEVSVATQSAVACAVNMTGPLTSEVDVLRAATTLLQNSQVPIPPSLGDAPPAMPPLETLPTATLPPRMLPLTAVPFPSPMSMSMPEYVPPP